MYYFNLSWIADLNTLQLYERGEGRVARNASRRKRERGKTAAAVGREGG